jgi:tRNA(adenine34) deaminase
MGDDAAAAAWVMLDRPWRLALEQAWTSAAAGSLGIGAVVLNAGGQVVASGRNRLMERDPGDDHLAGSSLAHAEMNALAKLAWRGHEGDRLTLWTTLEPCLMCAGAIRLAPIAEVRYLIADPLFEGVQRARELNAFIASSWPEVIGPLADPLAVLGILFPAHLAAFWQVSLSRTTNTDDVWGVVYPRIMALAAELAESRELVDAAAESMPIDDLIDGLWDRLVVAATDLSA